MGAMEGGEGTVKVEWRHSDYSSLQTPRNAAILLRVQTQAQQRLKPAENWT
jgi:hypothetical protein